VHRTLTNLFTKRGVTLDRSYQLNFGGNTDFFEYAVARPLKIKKNLQNRKRGIAIEQKVELRQSAYRAVGLGAVF
jgi:Myo-inositol-1-phosphate synthase